MLIDFCVWSPDEATFWQSLVDASICSAPNTFTPAYPGIEVSTSWGGTIANVSGWHCNVRVSGPLVAEMTYQLPQTDAEGVVLPLFDRTWAAQIFSLTPQPRCETTNYPAGMRNGAGVTYADPRDFATPSCVWA